MQKTNPVKAVVPLFFAVSQNDLAYAVLIQITLHSRGVSKPASYCSLVTLRFETCIEACLQLCFVGTEPQSDIGHNRVSLPSPGSKILAKQNCFKLNLAETSTIVLYSFESLQASLCRCPTLVARDVASARPRRALKCLDCRLKRQEMFHQQNRKGRLS